MIFVQKVLNFASKNILLTLHPSLCIIVQVVNKGLAFESLPRAENIKRKILNFMFQIRNFKLTFCAEEAKAGPLSIDHILSDGDFPIN